MAKFPWPQGSRMAVCLSWDVDGESALYYRVPDRCRHQLSELHQRMYGPTIAIWKILDLLAQHNIPGTFYVPGYIVDLYPNVIRAIKERGYPLGLHGYQHETMDDLDEAREAAVMARAQAAMRRVAGYVPTIYRSPSWELNRHSPALLVRSGIVSDSSLMDDEVPYALETPAGPLIEIPIQWIMDDAEYWLHTRANRDRPIGDPDKVFRLWSEEFQGYYESGGCFVLTLHPFISGRWVYIRTIDRFIRFMKGFPGIWWASLDEVTKHAQGLLAQGRLEVKRSPPPEPVKFDS